MINIIYSKHKKYDASHSFKDEVRNSRLAKSIKLDQVRQEIYTSGILIESITPKDSYVTYASNGKPYFFSSDRYFNVTHSDGYVICAYTEGAELGIDYERADRHIIKSIFKKLCNEPEKAFYDGLDDEKKAQFLLKLFTIKEAISKLLGTGLRSDFTNFSVSNLEGLLENSTFTVTDDKESYTVRSIDFLDGYLSIAVKSSDCSALREIQFEESTENICC